jgi:RHS repeat-associated protein
MRLGRVGVAATWLRGLIGVAFVAAGPALAAPPSVKIKTAPLLSPSAAYSYYTGQQDWQAWNNSTGEASRPREVRELSRALKQDPNLIYEFVRDNVETTWTYGLSKGAQGAIVDRAGNAFDQAHLMVELLRESNIPASFQIGTIRLSPAEFQAWTGVTLATPACQLLSSGGIPAIINNETRADCNYGVSAIASIEIGHAWVEAALGGTKYQFDPAYKPHTFKDGVDLAAAASLTPGQALAAASGGSDSGSADVVPYVRQLNTTALEARLTQYATGVQGKIENDLAAGSVEDLIGGKTIIRSTRPSGGWKQVNLPYPTTVFRTIAVGDADIPSGNLPNVFRTSLRVHLTAIYPTEAQIDKLLWVDEIYGRRLIFDTFFNHQTGPNSSGGLELREEGAPNVMLAPSPIGFGRITGWSIELRANLPYAAENGEYMDAVFARPQLYAGIDHVIVHGWGHADARLVDRWGQPRDENLPGWIPSGCDTCEVVIASAGDGRRQALAAAWLAQSSRAAELNAALAKSIYTHHYSIGLVAADINSDATVVDPDSPGLNRWSVTDSYDRMDFETGFSMTSRTADILARRAAIHATAASLEVLEGSVNAQVSDLPDTTSTATRFAWGNTPPEDPNPIMAASRRFLAFNSLTSGAAPSVVRADGKLATEDTASPNNDGRHSNSNIEVGLNEKNLRRGKLATAIQTYAVDGFQVVASEEAFLGPGQRGGSLLPSSPGTWTHQYTRQRGGALIAKKYLNDDPIEIAHVAISAEEGILKGGGGGAQSSHQAHYDPAKAADVLKARFVDRSSAIGVDLASGSVTYTSPATLSIGSGVFPYRLDTQLIWRGGVVEDTRFGAVSHVAPSTPWTTNWNNNLSISGSGLEAMGKTDIRAMAGTIATFVAWQDLYRAGVSTEREVTGALIGAWWAKQLAGNVVTVSVGASSRQFVRKHDGQWFAPGPGPYATLAQTGSRSIVARTGCDNPAEDNPMALSRGWRNAGMSFAVRHAQGDTQTFVAWEKVIGSGGACGIQQGFRLQTWTWPKNVSLTFHYEDEDDTGLPMLTRVSNSLGRQVLLTNNGLGGFNNGLSGNDYRAVTTTAPTLDPNGTYTHTDPAGKTTRFEVTRFGDQLRLSDVFAADDPNTAALHYDYDELGRVKLGRDRLAVLGQRDPHEFFLAAGFRGERKDPEGYTYSVDYDAEKRPVKVVDERGYVTAAWYDGRGRLKGYVYPELNREEFDYDWRNNMTLLRKVPKPGSTLPSPEIKATWDPVWNKIASLTDAKNQMTLFTYHPSNPGAGELASAVRPAVADVHSTYQFSYSAAGLVETSTDPTNVVTSFTYTPTGDLLTQTLDPSGVNAVTTYTNNVHGDPEAIDGPRTGIADISHVQYDAMRRKVLEAQPASASGHATAARTTYDAVARPTLVEQGYVLGGSFAPLILASTEYDGVGNKVRETTPGGVTQYSYDGLNRVRCTAKRVDPAVSPPADACQHSTPGAMGPDQISRNGYDPSGQLVDVTLLAAAGGGTNLVFASYTYSPNGQRTSVKDANNNLTQLVYDGLDRLLQQRFPLVTRGASQASTGDYEEYGYDLNGNRESLRKRNGETLLFGFDELDRMTLKNNPRTTEKDVFYTYDHAGRMTSARFDSFAGPGVVFEYDTAGRRTSETTFGRTVVSTLNKSGQRTGLGISGGASIVYDYDAAGRITAIRELGGSACPAADALVCLTYDPLGRRDRLNRGNGGYADYDYDPSGRLRELIQAGRTGDPLFIQTIAYNGASQIISLAQANDAFVWTARPPTRSETTHDGLNRDAAIAALPGGYDDRMNVANDDVRQMTYDLENRLLTVSPAAGKSGPSLALEYDPLGRLAKTVSSSTTDFLYDESRLVAEYGTSASPLRQYIHGDGIDEPLVWLEGAAKNWLHADRQGSVVGVSKTGSAGELHTYGPWGEASDWNALRFRYTGQIALHEAQLYHYKARVYDPSAGRFLQTDPIDQDDDPNLYAYVKADPANNTDPTGTELVGAIYGAISGGVGGYIASNGDWGATAVGAAAGGAVGVLLPPGAASGAAGSYAGQMAGGMLKAEGNVVQRFEAAKGKLDHGAALGAALGGKGGALVGRAAGAAVPGRLAPVIGSRIPGPAVNRQLGRTVAAVAEGAVAGTAERATQRGGVADAAKAAKGVGNAVAATVDKEQKYNDQRMRQ